MPLDFTRGCEPVLFENTMLKIRWRRVMSAEDKLMNPVRQRMQAGGVSLGMPVRLGRSGDIARIARSTGHDFIFIDCQHSLFNLETISHIASTAIACGVATLVRA